MRPPTRPTTVPATPVPRTPATRRPRLLATWACVAALAGAAAPLQAADEPPPPAAAAKSPLAKAREHIAAKRWPAALDELKRVNATGDADWQNLMGYTLRKQATPDLAGAERHYDAALKLNPSHRGALEYSGELYLMKGDPARAEDRLATLRKACGDCEEARDLKQALDRYKATGRYQPS
ncbi:tetratricopeptide repeat protein [Piscinibacter sakaiensis]|uniref:Tetratricopeptide repeat protein n=1 Tax=Piscinibacter sakaiensis TaxID=1547922 RepID=A0A0K8P6T8_PISS1|nr:tetratricopeptide repeat protein [Piscinibacter sakaiensis]GAP37935.1 hypothetical protein ISF6_4129 [Piscinibacter sakaiensis]